MQIIARLIKRTDKTHLRLLPMAIDAVNFHGRRVRQSFDNYSTKSIPYHNDLLPDFKRIRPFGVIQIILF